MCEKDLNGGDQNDLLSGVGLTSGRTTEKQRHLTVGNSLLGEIVEDDDGVAAVVTEPLTHRTLESMLVRARERDAGSLGLNIHQ